METMVTFSEIPEEVTLCINISGCPIHCPGCHSPHLWQDDGDPLTKEAVKELIESNKGISCIAFMGGDNNPAYINELAKYIKEEYPLLAIAWYSGADEISSAIDCTNFNYIKIGPYIKELGGLDCPNTNQKLFKVITYMIGTTPKYILNDITEKSFRKLKFNEDKN